MRTQQEDSHLQTRKRALTRIWLHWYPDLRLPASGTVRNKFLLFKPPYTWHLVKATWTKSVVNKGLFQGNGSSGAGLEVSSPAYVWGRNVAVSLCTQSCAMKMQLHFLAWAATFKRDCKPSLCSRAGGCLNKGTMRMGAFPYFISESALVALSPAWSWEPKWVSGPAQSWHYLHCPHSGSVALRSGCFSPGHVEKSTVLALLS